MQHAYRNLPDRRKAFKQIGKWLLAGGGALAVGYFALGREGPIDDWVAAGPVNSFPEGQIQPRRVTVTARGKWFDQHVERSVWIGRNSNGTVTVLSGICPHKNYNIAWQPNVGTFVCPGHKSAFDRSGTVLAGPSPRAMDTLEHKIENGILLVRYQKFVNSLPTKQVFT